MQTLEFQSHNLVVEEARQEFCVTAAHLRNHTDAGNWVLPELALASLAVWEPAAVWILAV